MTAHEWVYRKGSIPTCMHCGAFDPLWRCALEHGYHCERPECKPFPCALSEPSQPHVHPATRKRT